MRSFGVISSCCVSLLAAPAAAEMGEVCGDEQDHLFHCTFDSGAKQVSLCLTGDTVSYAFGAPGDAPELSLTSAVRDLDYLPYGWASRAIYESVALRNGNTTYEVFSRTERGVEDGITEGGIVVTQPDQSNTTLLCDQGSVVPAFPLDGIGQLAAFTPDNGWQFLSRCLENADPATCLGSVQRLEITMGRCAPGSDATSCWTAEKEAWDTVVAQQLSQARIVVAANGDAAFVDRLDRAQETWQQGRDLDCQIAGMLPFSPDGGAAFCAASKAAERIEFLRDVIGFVEFDG